MLQKQGSENDYDDESSQEQKSPSGNKAERPQNALKRTNSDKYLFKNKKSSWKKLENIRSSDQDDESEEAESMIATSPSKINLG